MATIGGPKIKNDILKHSIDSLVRSHKKDNSLINVTPWGLGSGGATSYSQNGATIENQRVIGTDPWGNSSIVWETRPSGDGEADGGWNTSYYSIDNTKLYRMSVWVKRTSSTSGGTFYLGAYGTPSCLLRVSDNVSECNPYWDCVGTGTFTQNVWYLVVGHIFPQTHTGTNRHPNTGRYTINGGKVSDVNGCNIGNDLKFASTTTSILHRTYHFYCNDNTTRLQFAYPRIDLCDGTEPSIFDLLQNKPYLIDNRGYDDTKGFLVNGITLDTTNYGAFNFDGVNDRIFIPSTTFRPYYISIWLYNNSVIPANDTAIGGPSTYQTLFSFGGGTAGVNLGGWTGAATNEAVHIWSTLNGAKLTYTNQQVSIGIHNFVFNWIGTRYDIWIDGVKQTVLGGSNGHAELINYVNTPIFIGSDNNTYHFWGKIYSFQIGEAPLSDNEITINYNQTKNRYF